MSIINAVIIGFIQGIAEFLPISSTGHLAIMSSLFNLSETGAGYELFSALLHFGSLVAIILVFWQDVQKLSYEIGAMINVGPYANGKSRSVIYARELLMMFFSSLPLVLLLFFKNKFTLLNGNSIFVGVMFILNGCILYVADKIQKGEKDGRNIGVLDSIIIGICQCVGVIPGISRIGVTAAAGVVNGLSFEYALRYSYLLSIPVLFGSNIIGLVGALRKGVSLGMMSAYLIGMVFSIIGGILALTLIKKLVLKNKFGGFSYYCWLAGAISIVLTMIF